MNILLSLAIINASAVYGVNADLLRAVAYVESSSGHNAALNKNKNGTYDAGPFQINSTHWNTTCKDLDVSKLQGNTDCAARLILKARKYAKTDPNWVGRYHSKTPSKKIKYAKKIKVYLDAYR